MKQPWYQECYRRTLLDMHVEDWRPELLAKYDPAEYVALLKSANVNASMIYANAHTGLCYWPTKSGHPHQAMGDRDWLGETIAALRKADIKVILYYSLLFNNRCFDDHPEWRVIDCEGKPSRSKERGKLMFSGTRYGIVCPNNLEYREFVKQQMQELLSGYDCDGVFHDMCFWSGLCYCPACEERFEKEIGQPMPRKVDWQDPLWIKMNEKQAEWIAEFGRFSSELVWAHDPNISVEHNSAFLTGPSITGIDEQMIPANTYIGGDLYGGVLEQSFVCKFYRSITPNMPFEFMTSRCAPSIFAHTSNKTMPMLRQHSLMTLAHQGAMLFIDAVGPDGDLDGAVYDRLKLLYDEYEQYEPLFREGQLLSNVHILYSMRANFDRPAPACPVEEYPYGMPHLNAAKALLRVAIGEHVPCNVITGTQIATLPAGGALMLGDCPLLTEEELDAIMDFAERGGRVYGSGHTLWALADRLGFEPAGYHPHRTLYADVREGGADCFGLVGKHELLQSDTRVPLVKNVPESCVVGRIWQCYVAPEDPEQLVSIHTTPPCEATEHPAFMVMPHGRGTFYLSVLPLEHSLALPNCETVLKKIIKVLRPAKPYFEAEAPASLEVIAYDQPEQKRMVVALITHQHESPPITTHGARVRLSVHSKVISVHTAIEEKPVPFSQEEDVVVIEVPPVDIALFLTVSLA